MIDRINWLVNAMRSVAATVSAELTRVYFVIWLTHGYCW
jgi:hypothetical protein